MNRQIGLSIAIFVTISVAFVATWWLSVSNRRNAARVRTEITAEQIAIRLEDFFRARIRVVDTFRMEWQATGPMDEATFHQRSAQIQSRFPGFQALNWVDQAGSIRWVEPMTVNSPALNHNLHGNKNASVREAIERAESQFDFAITGPVELVQGGMGIACYFPLVRNGELEGFLNGVFRIGSVVDQCINAEITSHFDLRLEHGDTIILRRGQHFDGSDADATPAPLRIGDQTWILRMIAHDRSRQNLTSILEYAILLIGVSLALALALAVRFAILKQARLAESEAKYGQLFKHANDGVLMLEGEHIVECNTRASTLFQARQSDLIGHTFEDISPRFQPTGAQSRDIVSEDLSQLASGKGLHREWVYQRPDGSTFDAEISLNTYTNNGATLTLAIIRDITSRKRAEQAMRESEEKYRLLVENARDAIFIVQNGCIKFPNPQTIKAIGYSVDELQDKHSLDIVHFDDRERVQSYYADLLAGVQPPSIETFRILAKSGALLWVEMSTVPITWEKQRATLNIVRDITEHKRLEERLNESQRMEAIGRLAGGVAHDFNNLLMGIQGNTTLLGQDLRDRKALNHLSDIESLVQSGAELTRQLVGFARGNKVDIEPHAINSILEKIVAIFSRTHKDIGVHQSYSPEVPAVQCDRGQIERVVLNILVNAAQVMDNRGDIWIQTETVQQGSEFCEPYDMEPGTFARITIRDNGPGMDEHTRKRVFEPFFSKKYKRRGTGLGLASAYGIVRAHAGHISVDSELGKGTAVHVLLPTCTEPIREDPQGSNQVVLGQGRILVVDDEEDVLNVTCGMLAALGYETRPFLRGSEALAQFRQSPEAFDLVVMDMIMPDIKGPDLFQRIREINPRMAVLVASGYIGDNHFRDIVTQDRVGFIQKPFRLNELSSEVATLIGTVSRA